VRSGLIDYTMMWPPGDDAAGEENLKGIFDLVRAGSGYQIIWSSGGHLTDGTTPRRPLILRTAEVGPDVYLGHGEGRLLFFFATVTLVSVAGIDVDLDPDEGLRKRLGG
jgi:hypothetical protein